MTNWVLWYMHTFTTVLKSLILVLIFHNSYSNKDKSSTSILKFFLFSRTLQFKLSIVPIEHFSPILFDNANHLYVSKNINGIWYKKYCNKNYILVQLKWFVKLLSHLWWEAWGIGFKYSYIMFLQLSTSEMCQNIGMSDSYKGH